MSKCTKEKKWVYKTTAMSKFTKQIGMSKCWVYKKIGMSECTKQKECQNVQNNRNVWEYKTILMSDNCQTVYNSRNVWVYNTTEMSERTLQQECLSVQYNGKVCVNYEKGMSVCRE